VVCAVAAVFQMVNAGSSAVGESVDDLMQNADT
jgi:hypothetical protein